MPWFPIRGSSVAGPIDDLFLVILAITGFFFLLVFGLFFYAIIRFREGRSERARYLVGAPRLELALALLFSVILIGLAFYSDSLWGRIRKPTVTDPVVVRIAPRQFQWDVRYAGKDGRFGTPDDRKLLNRIRLPKGRWARLELDAQDVIHSFFVPQLRVKQDAVPGTRATVLVMPSDTGSFEIVCAELCGLGHYRMRGVLTVMEPEAYKAWEESDGRRETSGARHEARDVRRERSDVSHQTSERGGVSNEP